jgi:hypothetical protein
MHPIDANQEKLRNRLRLLARLMDARFSMGGIKFGWDGILGLIPGLGEIVTTIVSLYIIVAGWQMGLPVSVLVRMAFNVVFDNVLSNIPLFGWIVDFFYRSNLKNVDLIEKYLANPQQTVSRSRVVLGLIVLLVFAISIAIFYAFIALTLLLFDKMF